MRSLLHASVAALLLTAACSKADKPAPNGGGSSAASPVAGTAAINGGSGTPPAANANPSGDGDSSNDYAKPTLTEDKLQRYIKSLAEGNNPFKLIGTMMGSGATMEKAQAALAEQEAFAKKYGFKDTQEYMDVYGRAMVGVVAIGAEESMGKMAENMKKSIEMTEKQIADPATTPEMKEALQDSLKTYKESLAEMQKPQGGTDLNKPDMDLIRKHYAELVAAQKVNSDMIKKMKE